MLKRSVKMGSRPAQGVEAQMRFNLNKIFASDAWAEMSLNESKWAQKSLNEPKSI